MDDQKRAVELLEFGKRMWDGGKKLSWHKSPWDGLTMNQREVAMLLNLDRAEWDKCKSLKICLIGFLQMIMTFLHH